MCKVKQEMLRPKIEDLHSEIEKKMQSLAPAVRPGMSIAVTAGSRGIHNISAILKSVVKVFREMEARPFIVSAMGSHGGGTVPGQEDILRGFGIIPNTVGAPLRVTSEAVEVGTTLDGSILYADAEAVKADGVFLVNRIKPHTAFRADLASGLFKILTVGLGKVAGATQIHKIGASGMYRSILEMGRLALEKLTVIGGLAIVENGYEETAYIECLLPDKMEDGERELLKTATSLLPGLPVKDLDLLIVEEMGKNFSGTGMDTNVIGRWRLEGIIEPEFPRIKKIVVLSLSAASEGNANGIGLADFTTARLTGSINWERTLTNAKATGFWSRAHCPPFLPNDREAVRWALLSLKLPAESPLRAARIRSTLRLDELWLTPMAFKNSAQCEQISPFLSLQYNEKGDLLGET